MNSSFVHAPSLAPPLIHFAVLLSLALTPLVCHGQNLPKEALLLVQNDQKESEAIQAKADEQIRNLRKKTIADLESLKAKFTKMGKLEEAIATMAIARKLSGFDELVLLQHPESKDFLLAAHKMTIEEATKKGYLSQGGHGVLFAEQAPNTIPLISFWNEDRKDYMTCATDESIKSQLGIYQMIRVEGYIYAKKAPASVPLVLYFKGPDNATVNPEVSRDMEQSGFSLVRVEGWIPRSK